MACVFLLSSSGLPRGPSEPCRHAKRDTKTPLLSSSGLPRGPSESCRHAKRDTKTPMTRTNVLEFNNWIPAFGENDGVGRREWRAFFCCHPRACPGDPVNHAVTRSVTLKPPCCHPRACPGDPVNHAVTRSVTLKTPCCHPRACPGDPVNHAVTRSVTLKPQ